MVHKKKYDVVTTFPNYDLHGAAAAGNIGLVIYALTHGQPINAVLGGLLPLHAAASGGSVEVIQLLIDQGADVNAPRLPSNTGPPIGVGGAGSMVGPGGIIDDGHHHGTGTSATGEKLHKGRVGSAGGHTHSHAQPPVTPMARPGSSNSAQSLPIGRRGSTPLHFAAAMGHMEVVRLLLDNGANPAAKDVEKSTPEMVARAAGKIRAADFLREWQASANSGAGIEAMRRSFESPSSTIGTAATNSTLKPVGTASDLRLNAVNSSTASLPLAASTPASHSTSSLGRYPNSGRRPSLPSIYESPPSTSYPRPSSGKKPLSPERPATAASMNPSVSSLPKLPFTIRRPKSAGNKDGRSGANDDASSQHSHSSRNQAYGTASRLNRIFKRPNLRPATASGALSTSPSPTSPSPPAITRSRSPSASRVIDKDNRSGGFFHGHLPHLTRRDHGHTHPHHQHFQPQHVSRDAISGPIMNGPRPSTSIPDIARPDLLDVGQHSSTSVIQITPSTADMSTSPDEMDEEAALYKALNLTPAELQYTKTRGAMPDRLKNPVRTAPPGQSSFGIGKKQSGSSLNRYPSHQALTTKSASTLPSPHIIPRHRAHLGPNGGLAMTVADQAAQDEYNRIRSETPLGSGLNMDRLSPVVHSARPVASYASLNQEIDTRRTEIRQQGDGAGSISSLDSHLSGSFASDALRSPEGTEDLNGDYISRPVKAASGSTTHSPGGTSPSAASPGSMPFVDGRLISSRAQALELVEAQKRAIQTDHRERIKARRLASASSHKTGASYLADTTMSDPNISAEIGDIGNSSSPVVDTEDENASLDEDDVNALREKLAALGETVQIERRFARGEQQAKRWNRESGLEDGLGDSLEDVERGNPASYMGASVLARNEMLAGYLRQGEPSETEKVRRPPTPKRDVFGRPVTPKKEGRPPTPKENRPTTPKLPVTPTTSRFVDVPRENRVLPPPSKSPQPTRSPQHLTLQQVRAISKSDLGLSSYVNKDDLGGRERAWTTTDVRPRVGPSTPSRPSTAGAKPALSPSNGGLTIDIIQTMPTPTDGGASPLRKTPVTPSSPSGQQTDETLQSRRRYNSNPLRIDAKSAQEKALAAKESFDEAPQASPNTAARARQGSNSRPRKPTTPTKEQSSVLLHRITATPPVAPPTIALVPPSETPFNSFLSVSSNGGQETPERELPPTPVPVLPSAVSLHNMHVARAKEEAMKYNMENPPIPQGSPPDNGSATGHWTNTPPSAAERRLGLGLGNQNAFGYESVRSFNEEKGGDKSWRILGFDGRESDTSNAGKSGKSKLGGLFSRLKR